MPHRPSGVQLALQETGNIVERDGRLSLAARATDRLPATLIEVLLARLDRLEAQERTEPVGFTHHEVVEGLGHGGNSEGE